MKGSRLREQLAQDHKATSKWQARMQTQVYLTPKHPALNRCDTPLAGQDGAMGKPWVLFPALP